MCRFRRGVVILVILAGLSAGACASTGAVPRPFPTPGGSGPAPPAGPLPPGPATRPPAPDAYAITGTALALRGVPYRNGGGDPSGFDCSGFTQYVFAQYGVALPREVRDQFLVGTGVKPEEVAAGDLLFFSTVAPGPSHVGIALGGDQFVHAPSSAGVVRVERLNATYWSQRLVGIRRPL